MESTVGQGSAFHFTADLGVGGATELPPLATRTDLAELSAQVTRHSRWENRKKFHVLLAEDNVVNQKLAARLLEKQGHRVTVVGNGRAALAALAREKFDVVLMDVQMPEMEEGEPLRRG